MFKVKKKQEKQGDGDTKEKNLAPHEEAAKDLRELEDSLDKLVGESLDPAVVDHELAILEKELGEALPKGSIKPLGEPAGSVVAHKKVAAELKSVFPLWVEKPIYWITPDKKFTSRHSQWLKEWGDFVLQFAAAKKVYVIVIRDVMQEFPFKNHLIGKSLTSDQLILITDHLVSSKKARWLDPQRTRVQAFWQTTEETVDDFFRWAMNTGSEYLSVFEILEKTRWNTLPEEHLDLVFEMLVRTNRATWTDKNKSSIHLNFKI